MFKKKKQKTLSKVDKLVTGVIIGSAIASIFGLSKTEKGKEITGNISKKSKGIFSRTYGGFSKMMSFIFGVKKNNVGKK